VLGADTCFLVSQCSLRAATATTVYNFTVPAGATYFVESEQGARLWVHNVPCNLPEFAVLMQREARLQFFLTRTPLKDLSKLWAQIAVLGKPKWVVGSTGYRSFWSNSAALRANLTKVYGLARIAANMAAHHLIPGKVLRRHMQFFKDIGFQHNEALNGCLLPAKKTSRWWTRHAGSHDGYSFAINVRIKEIEKQFTEAMAQATTEEARVAITNNARKQVEELANTARKALHERSIDLAAMDAGKGIKQEDLCKFWQNRLGVVRTVQYIPSW
jgi:predicted lactoylglutathione lyase